ncbi:AAA family ATPase [Methylobacterium sp. J-068]|uniref:AAA family ATPase n=1 Tax=Methylobacterium sp. J-068 TaxID=2836649 RepID=UPI001FB91334|nr:AAA family ATPase [Methylobacterium sp. J-068]MCJ2036469.1 helicase RepA family protein [Methylobacterium sp. J-068]
MDADPPPHGVKVARRNTIRRYLSVTVSPGGIGKSSLEIGEALSMVSGRDLLGTVPEGKFKVWYWNGEDPLDELQRRIMAAALHYELEPADLHGRLFVNSGRDTEIIIAQQDRNGVTVAVPVVDAIKETIRENGIDVLIIDPFVSSHGVSENDNGAIDRVAKTWAKIAEETNCSIELVHHSRKTNGNEVTVEDSRGAVALLSAARSARVLNQMTKDEGERAGVEFRRLHFRVDNGKANLAPPPEGSMWFKLESVDLGNGNGMLGSYGDRIGVVAQWQWPDPMADVSVKDLRAAQTAVSAGRWRDSHQASDWVGKAIGQALRLDPANPKDKRRILSMLKTWKANGMFVVVEGKDAKHNTRSFVEVGEWATD